MITSCVIIGSGNVAYHIANVLKQTLKFQLQIFGRNSENVLSIAQSLDIPYTTNINEINSEADIYLLCVSDSAIGQVASLPILKNKFLVHLAGSVNLDVLSAFTNTSGVLYPLQSFTKSRILNYSEIPFFIEASESKHTQQLHDFASNISANITVMSSSERLWLHLAAVVSSNFSNHMYSIAHRLLMEHNLSFDVLQPLIIETTKKAFAIEPAEAQTGPAIRNNLLVMDKHIEMLGNHPDWQKIYTFVSNSILQMKDDKIQ